MLVAHKEGVPGGEHAAAGSTPHGQRIGHLSRGGGVHERAGDGRVGAHRGVVIDQRRGHTIAVP